MWKFFTIVLSVGAAGMLATDSAQACGGGGGGGCGMSGGGYGGGYGGRTVASRKALTGGPSLAKAGPATARRYAHSSAPAKSTVAAKPARTGVRTVAATNTKTGGKQIYTCPMHPQVQWTKPVDCPICGMKLKLKAVRGPGKPAPDPAASTAPEADDAAMADMPGMDMSGMGGGADMGGMDDMMCPGCMGGMSGMGGGNASPKASRKVSPGRSGAGMGCGC